MCPPHLFQQKGQAGSTKHHRSPKVSVFGWFLPQAIRILIQEQFTLMFDKPPAAHNKERLHKNASQPTEGRGGQNFLSK